MFSLPHCTAAHCNMNGSNSLDESDRKPLELCSQRLAKLCYATGVDPEKHLHQLAAFCQAEGLTAEQGRFDRSLEALTKVKK